MSRLKLALKDSRHQFRPGEEIAGAAGWECAEAPERVEIRLFYRTEGKGDTDLNVVDTVRWDQPQASEARPFSMVAPSVPYSFSGKIVSLVWALEMVIHPGKVSERVDLVIAPSGQEIVLHGVS